MEERKQQGKLLCASYFFAAWGDRMWEFAVIVFLLDLFPNSLLAPSVFGLFENVAGIVWGSSVGAYIDRAEKLESMRRSIVGQNVAVGLASILFSFALQNTETITTEQRHGVLVVIIVAGMLARVSSSMNKISIHKVWGRTIASGDETLQTDLNASLRRVDLCCSIFAPMAVGILSIFLSSSIVCALVAAWSFTSMFVEFRLAGYVYERVPQLHEKMSPKSGSPTGSPQKTFDGVTEKEAEPQNCLSRYIDEMSQFVKHRSFSVAIPYALLYCSVLSFHGSLVSYLKSLGVANVWLAAGRAGAAVISIGSTFVIPGMVKSSGLIPVGVKTLFMQVGCLTPLVVAFIIWGTRDEQAQPLFIGITFVAVCLSRFGLWGFDLAQTQMMQILVESEVAGVINGSQEMVINGCYLTSYLLTVIFSNPADFKYPVFVSYSLISLAAALFWRYSKQTGGVLPEPSQPGEPAVEDERHLDILMELPL